MLKKPLLHHANILLATISVEITYCLLLLDPRFLPPKWHPWMKLKKENKKKKKKGRRNDVKITISHFSPLFLILLGLLNKTDGVAIPPFPPPPPLPPFWYFSHFCFTLD